MNWGEFDKERIQLKQSRMKARAPRLLDERSRVIGLDLGALKMQTDLANQQRERMRKEKEGDHQHIVQTTEAEQKKQAMLQHEKRVAQRLRYLTWDAQAQQKLSREQEYSREQSQPVRDLSVDPNAAHELHRVHKMREQYEALEKQRQEKCQSHSTEDLCAFSSMNAPLDAECRRRILGRNLTQQAINEFNRRQLIARRQACPPKMEEGPVSLPDHTPHGARTDFKGFDSNVARRLVFENDDIVDDKRRLAAQQLERDREYNQMCSARRLSEDLQEVKQKVTLRQRIEQAMKVTAESSRMHRMESEKQRKQGDQYVDGFFDVRFGNSLA